MDSDDQLCKVMKEKHLESVYNSAKGRGDHAFGADSMFLSSVKKAVAAIRIIQETKGEVIPARNHARLRGPGPIDHGPTMANAPARQ